MRIGLAPRRGAPRWLWTWALAFALTCLGQGARSHVIAGTPDRDASTLIHSLMSPFCPGLLLADCPSGRAQDLRTEIRERLSAGETPGAIEADVVERFGTRVRTVPAFQGVGILAWVGPAAIGGLGFIALIVAVRSLTDRAPAPAQPNPRPASAEDARILARLQDELDDLD